MDDQFGQYRVALKYAVPILLFLLFFSPDILDPTNIGWLLKGDWGQHFLGWHAYRQTPLQWPYNHETLLASPTGLSLIYTDSNALLALPLRWLSPFLPENFQYIGPWFLICVCLHYYIAYRLIKPHAPGGWSAIAGATLISLMPTLYNRMGHDTLMAHWLILWALFIFFNVTSERKKTTLYALLLFICGLVHPYILVMVLFIWAADNGRVMWSCVRERRFVDLYVACGMAAGSFLPAIIGLGMAGAFSGSSANADGFGIYSMPLDAIINPARKDFTLALLRGPQDERQAFEGFQYLGAGLIALIALAIYSLKRLTPPASEDATERTQELADPLERARGLIWPFVMLTLLAVSNELHIYGLRIVRIPLPDALIDLLNIVRASGRLFWPVAYAGAFLGLCVLYRQRGRVLQWGLPAILVLQLIDIVPFAATMNALTAPAKDRQITHIATSPKWANLISTADRVSFQPPSVLANKEMFYEITYHAVSRGIAVNTMYAARENPVQAAIELKEHRAFSTGKLSPRTLYVLMSHCDAPPGAEGRLRELDGVWILPPEGSDALSLKTPQPVRYRFGETYAFDQGAQATCQLDGNWLLPELGGVRTESRTASLTLPLEPTAAANGAFSLHLTAQSFAKGDTGVTVTINGIAVSRLSMNKKVREHVIQVPAGTLTSDRLTVGFVIDPPTTAQDSARRLKGLKLHNLRLTAA